MCSSLSIWDYSSTHFSQWDRLFSQIEPSVKLGSRSRDPFTSTSFMPLVPGAASGTLCHSPKLLNIGKREKQPQSSYLALVSAFCGSGGRGKEQQGKAGSGVAAEKLGEGEQQPWCGQWASRQPQLHGKPQPNSSCQCLHFGYCLKESPYIQFPIKTSCTP